MNRPIPVIVVCNAQGGPAEVTFNSTTAARESGIDTKNSMPFNGRRYLFPQDWDFDSRVAYMQQFASYCD